MRIGLIAPPWLPVPPVGYGGTEKVVDDLARALQLLGHEVILFTVGSSTCPVQRLFRYDDPVPELGTTVAELAHSVAASDALLAAGVEVIHDHTVAGPFVAQGHADLPPVVVTHHGVFDDAARSIFAYAAKIAAVVSISHSQRATAPDVPVAAVIHHGVDLDTFRQGPGGDDLVFIGRMSPDKGLPAAIRVARKAGRRLRVLSKMWEAREIAFFEQEIQPLLGNDIDLRDNADPEEQLALLQTSAALLNPICWNEPFGLVMAEALACGTPVLTFPNGAAPEIVDQGTTGFLCANEVEMADAIADLPRLHRDACRQAAERRFSARRMATDHVALYTALLESQGNPLPWLVGQR
jgi:glycosyltransferase involved in cell wall biosynthesis